MICRMLPLASTLGELQILLILSFGVHRLADHREQRDKFNGRLNKEGQRNPIPSQHWAHQID